MIYAGTKDASFYSILSVWRTTWFVYSAPIGWGFIWVTQFQKTRLKKLSKKVEIRAFAHPVVFYFVTLFVNLVVGFGASLAAFFLTH